MVLLVTATERFSFERFQVNMLLTYNTLSSLELGILA